MGGDAREHLIQTAESEDNGVSYEVTSGDFWCS